MREVSSISDPKRHSDYKAPTTVYIYRNLETLSINTCRLHGSPKSSSATVSPLHRVQNLDLMDDIRLPFPKENHNNSPVSMTPSSVMDHHHHHHHHQQHHASMTPSRSFRQQPSLHQNNSDLASSTNKIKSSGNCCGGPGGGPIVTAGSAGNGVAASSSSSACCAGASSSSSHQQHQAKPDATSQQLKYRWHGCPELHKAMDGVTYIADHTKKEEESTKVRHFFL